MSSAVAGIVLVAMACWVLAPDPHHRLRRLEPARPWTGGHVARLMHGKKGALPLPARILAGLAAGLVLFTLLPTTAGGVALVVAPLAIVVGGGQVSLSHRDAVAGQEELADTVELLAVCLSAGAPMRHALEAVVDVPGIPTSTVLSKVLGQLSMGVTEQQAWQELVEDEVWGQVARDVARSARSGTSLVDVLHVHADEARLVTRERALERARTAGVRSVVPLMACFLPAFVLVGVVPIIAGLLDGLPSP